MSSDVAARLVGPLSIDRYLDTGENLPGGGALNMAYHWARRELRCELISRVAPDGAELFESFLDRHGIAATPSLVQPGTACAVDIRFADDRQPMMDNFVEGVLGEFRLDDAEADRVTSGVPAHLVLVDVIDRELHRLADRGPLGPARLTGDFLSFRHFTPERFSASMALLEIGFVGWPGSPDDAAVADLAARAVAAGTILVITFGSAGVRVVDARAAEVSDAWFAVDAIRVAGTTVGCGDAFIAAFLAAWYRSGDIGEAVDAGRALGAAATGWHRPLPDDAYA
jgi:sugar/nucleoside kinase (ribokinase family)